MSSSEILKQISCELKEMKGELDFIKEHMVDIDSIMTEDDFLALKKYRNEKKKGQLISHKQLKKMLSI